jgi:hypothetical protein
VILGLPTHLFVAGQLWGVSTLAQGKFWKSGVSVAQHGPLAWATLLAWYSVGGYFWSRMMFWWMRRVAEKAEEKAKEHDNTRE